MGAVLSKLLSLGRQIKTMIQHIVVTESRSVIPGEYPTFQVRGLGNRISDVDNVTPYGLLSTPPLGSFGVKFNVQGEASNQVGLVYDPTSLVSLLPDGEVAVGNFKKGSYLKFTTLGTVEVWNLGILRIADLANHVHTGVTTGSGLSGPPSI